MDDWIAGLTRWPPNTKGSFGNLVRCIRAKPGFEPNDPFTYLDNEDIERALGISKMDVNYFNRKDGYKSQVNTQVNAVAIANRYLAGLLYMAYIISYIYIEREIQRESLAYSDYTITS